MTTTLEDEITRAIGAHGTWKRRLLDAIDSGRSEFTVAKVSTDNACDFGRWFYGLPATERATDDARKVQQLHASFHHEAGTVLAAALAGNKSEAAKRLAVSSQFAKVSGDLTGAMMQWRSHRHG